MTARVAIVGGGISGLAAAERLIATDPCVHVTILEASERLGGVIRTRFQDGYVIEEGPDVFLASKAAARELCDRVGLGDRLHGTTAGVHGSYVLRKGRLHRLPAGLSGLVPTRIRSFMASSLLSWRGKLRVVAEAVIPPSAQTAEESVESFVVRRLGREAYGRMIEPLLSGIYAGDGARLSIDATFPQLRRAEVEHGSLLRSMRARRARAGNAASVFLSLAGGLEQMVHALERALLASGRVTIERASPVERVERASGGACVALRHGQELEMDGVIVATPAPAAAEILSGVLPSAGAALRAIEHSSVAIVSLGYERGAVPRALDATGYTVPRSERRPTLACTWSSSKFPGRAPGSKALLRVFIGGVGRMDTVGAPDAALVQVALTELEQTLAITTPPELVHVTRWPDGMPQYNVGHLARVAAIHAAVECAPWLALAGNSFGGVGIPDCIAGGQRAADRIVAQLRVAPRSRAVELSA